MTVLRQRKTNSMDRNSTILIIDDEPALLLGLAAKVKRQGYQVVTASNGNEGLQKARVVMPDLILSDVMMPPPKGFERRKLMGQDPLLADIPFIFLTARSDVEDRVNGIRDGADDYITKPFVTEELLVRIEALLRRVQVARTRGREETREVARRDMERLKQEILHNFHHEMRTPLANITMPLELIVNNKFEDPKEQIEFIKRALSSVERLESVVTDFTLLNNIDGNSLNRIRQTIDLRNHIFLPIQKRMERYKAKGLQLIQEFRGHGNIAAPRRELSHAIVHLIDNACKFSPDRSSIKLTMEANGNGGAVFDIEDGGPGIPQEEYEKVFERFYQISRGDAREYGGLGIGLFITRAVFSNLRGRVTILPSSSGCHVQAILPPMEAEDIIYG